MSYIIYGKRTGMLDDNGNPTHDKTFKALNYEGQRVNVLTDAGTYAEKQDAQDIINTRCKTAIEQGLAVYEIRKAK